MGCYSKQQLAELQARRAQRKVDTARLENYKPLYLAARAAREHLSALSVENAAIVAQLDAALIDPHQMDHVEKKQ